MSASLKIGLMGYGFAGATFHAPVIEHCGRASIAAIATSQPEHALADYPHAKVVADLDATIFGKQTVFDFQRHRRIKHGRITSQTGVMLPPEA